MNDQNLYHNPTLHLFKKRWTGRLKNILRIEIVFFFLLFIFANLLMWKTFRVNGDGNLEISTKVWSDFAAAIPLIRSFSFGSNFPLQYPLFAGPPIRYHFVFFALVGILEKYGLPLDWALNSFSAISFFLLCIGIYALGKQVFKNRAVGFLAVLLFLFNGSLSFLEYFKTHPLKNNFLSGIFQNNIFSSFGPYDGKIISAFWNLNIFTNQRHLALAYASFLFLLLFLYQASNRPKKFSFKKSLLLGTLIGLFPFIHLAVFGMMGFALITLFFVYPKLRKQILTVGAITLVWTIPQILSLGPSEIKTSFFKPGYLIEKLTFINFINYWFLNLGITIFFVPFGLALSNRKQRMLFIPFLTLFIIGNLFQFSTELAANHKFFNLFVIGANLYVAFFLVKLWGKKIIGKIGVGVLLFLLTLSGIIDFFPILNDTTIELKDYPNNPAVKFIVENTPKNSAFLNSSFLYHPASIAGRKIFMGWPYFPWSAGYDTHQRKKIMEKFYISKNKTQICQLLKTNHLDYFTVEDTRNDNNFPTIDLAYFQENFISSYKQEGFLIFKTSLNCQIP